MIKEEDRRLGKEGYPVGHMYLEKYQKGDTGGVNLHQLTAGSRVGGFVDGLWLPMTYHEGPQRSLYNPSSPARRELKS